MVRTSYHTPEDNDLEWLEHGAIYMKKMTFNV